MQEAKVERGRKEGKKKEKANGNTSHIYEFWQKQNAFWEHKNKHKILFKSAFARGSLSPLRERCHHLKRTQFPLTPTISQWIESPKISEPVPSSNLPVYSILVYH